VNAVALTRPVLVLNRRWQPCQTTSAVNAFALVMKGNAVIIDANTFAEHDLTSWKDVSEAQAKYQDAVIHTPRLTLVVPEVIRLKGYDGLGEGKIVFSRRNIFKRDRYTCQYCGAQPGPKELTIDHVLPKSRGGKSDWLNCVLACVTCNARKANKTPAEARLVLRKVPRKPRWTALSHIPVSQRRLSWETFLSKAYWEVELE